MENSNNGEGDVPPPSAGSAPSCAGFYWVRNIETNPASRWEVCEVRPEFTRSGFMACTPQYPDGFFTDKGGLEWDGPICEPNAKISEPAAGGK